MSWTGESASQYIQQQLKLMRTSYMGLVETAKVSMEDRSFQDAFEGIQMDRLASDIHARNIVKASTSLVDAIDGIRTQFYCFDAKSIAERTQKTQKALHKAQSERTIL